jgi:2-polyprenyl-3-methyl-5-hydroxy-6-metoxy-1,4-benzoquinol methylase
MDRGSEEKVLQEKFGRARQGKFENYTEMLKHFQAQSCMENCPGPSVLDLACGDARITKFFAEKYDRVVGVDASGFRLEKAKERCPAPNVRFCESLIEEFESDERFNSVFLLNILEHVRDPIEILRHAASFLTEDGVLCVHVPNAHAINRKLALLMGTLEALEELSPYDLEVGHRRYYTRESLTDDVSKAGLKVIKSGGVFYKMLSSPQIDWFLENGLWEEGGFGWGRVGEEKTKDWRMEFCRASYEIGKEYPEECNIVYVLAQK